MFTKIVSRTLFAMLIVLSFSTAYAIESAGMVVDVVNNAWIERDGTKTAIKLKTPIFVTDVVSTDATGRVQILFNDDTSLAVGASSTVSIDNFVFNTDATPSFAVSAVKGVSRVITGKIVEQNREGFKVSTPLATVGIRGTIVTISVEDVVSVILDQIGEGHNISVVGNDGEERTMNIAGYTIKVSPEGQVGFPEETTDEDIQIIGQALGLGTSDDDEGDDDDDSDDTGTQSGTTSFLNDDDDNDDDFDDDNDDIKYAQDDINDLDDRDDGLGKQEKLATYQSDSKQTGFNVDLNSGSVKDAYFTYVGVGKGVVQASDGTGTLTAGSYDANGIFVDATLNISGFDDIETNGTFDDDGVTNSFMNVTFIDKTRNPYANSANASFGFTFGGDNYTGTDTMWQQQESSEEIEAPEIDSFTEAYFSTGNPYSNAGFTIALGNGAITEAYFVHTDTQGSNGTVIATNGTGNYNASTGTYTVSSYDISGDGGYFYSGSTYDPSLVGNASASGSISSNIASMDYEFYINGDFSDPLNQVTGNINGGILMTEKPGIEPSKDMYREVYTYFATADNKAGFSMALVGGLISNAYFTHSDVKGTVLATGGTGSVHDGTFYMGGFTYTTDGAYVSEYVDNIYGSAPSSSGYTHGYGLVVDYAYGNFGTYKFGYNGEEITGVYDVSQGQGILPAGVPNVVPTLPERVFNVAEYSGALVVSGISGSTSGNFGFQLDLNTGYIYNAYVHLAEYYNSNNSLFFVGGEGLLTGGDYNVDVSSFSTDVSNAEISAFGGTVSGSNATVNAFDITDGGSTIHESVVQGNATQSGSVAAKYSYTDSQGVELGFMLNTGSGVVTDAYVVIDDAASDNIYILSGGAGAAVSDGSNGYNIYLDDFTDRSAGFKDNGNASSIVKPIIASVNENGELTNASVTGMGQGLGFDNATSVDTTNPLGNNQGNFDIPTHADFTKQATYASGNFEMSNSASGVNYTATAGFNIDFIANEISGAYLKVGSGDNFANFENGSSKLYDYSEGSGRDFNIYQHFFTSQTSGGALENAVLNSYDGNIADNAGNAGDAILNVGVTVGSDFLNNTELVILNRQ